MRSQPWVVWPADAVVMPPRLLRGVSWRVAAVVEGEEWLMTSTAVPRSAARLRRLDLRVVIGLALLLAGVVGTVGVVQRAGQRTPVLVMARDVPAGQVIGAQDVRAAELGLAPGVAALGVRDRGRVVGQVARVPLAAGQVLGPTAVTEDPPLAAGQALMSVAVAPEHAAAGTLRAGDQVAVVVSSPPDQPTTARAAVLLSPVLVLSVVAPDPDAGGDGKLLVSLAIPEQQAAALAQATHGTLDLVLLADLDPAGGDVAAHLPVPDVRRGIAPLLGLPAGQLDPAAVHAESTQVGWGLRVLVGLPRPDTGGLLRPDATLALLRAARGVVGVELLVVDPGRLLPGSAAAGTLGLAEVRVLAARADLPGALAAQRALAATQHAHVMAVVAVAVQRPADATELAHALRRPLAGVIPADPKAVRRALQTGQPPTSGRLGHAYTALAAQLHPAGGRASRRHTRGRRGALGPGEAATPP